MNRPFWERVARVVGIDRTEQLVGRLIVGAAAARMHRDEPAADDMHEVRHLYAAVKAGNSDDCDASSCILDCQALADWNTLQQNRYDDPFYISSGNVTL